MSHGINNDHLLHVRCYTKCFLHALLSVLSEVDPETSICVQVIYWKGDPSKSSIEKKRDKKGEGGHVTIRQATSTCNWSSVPSNAPEPAPEVFLTGNCLWKEALP